MQMNTKYDALIKSIKSKRRWVIGITLAVVIVIVLFTTPINIVIMGKTLVDYEGWSPITTILLVFLVLFIELIAYGAVSVPMTASMDMECDPEKHLILNVALNNQYNIQHVYAMDYLYLGNYLEAMRYADMMILSPKEIVRLVGFFNKARCAFLLNDSAMLKQTASQYAYLLANNQKIKPKALVECHKMQDVLNLLCAIADNDIDAIDGMRNRIDVWNKSKATEGFVNYIKGVSAYRVNDKEEAVYRLKLVKENCSKTVFASLSDKLLALLK